MKYFLINIFGLDDFFDLKINRIKLSYFVISLIIILLISFFSLFYAFYMMTQSIFLSAILSFFFTAFILNIYRLIFSISNGGTLVLKEYSTFIKEFFMKSFIIIILSIFISKTIEVALFESPISFHLNAYKKSLLNNYDKLQRVSYDQQIIDLEYEFEEKLAFDKIIGVDNSKGLEKNLNQEISSIEILAEKKLKTVKRKILDSNFFITKIKILSYKLPSSWIFTFFILLLFLSPIYIFMTDPVFKSYNSKIEKLNFKIIQSDYEFFKSKYSQLLFDKLSKKIELEEYFEDPPFNKTKKTLEFKILKKGSLLTWLQNYD